MIGHGMLPAAVSPALVVGVAVLGAGLPVIALMVMLGLHALRPAGLDPTVDTRSRQYWNPVEVDVLRGGPFTALGVLFGAFACRMFGGTTTGQSIATIQGRYLNWAFAGALCVLFALTTNDVWRHGLRFRTTRELYGGHPGTGQWRSDVRRQARRSGVPLRVAAVHMRAHVPSSTQRLATDRPVRAVCRQTRARGRSRRSRRVVSRSGSRGSGRSGHPGEPPAPAPPAAPALPAWLLRDNTLLTFFPCLNSLFASLRTGCLACPEPATGSPGPVPSLMPGRDGALARPARVPQLRRAVRPSGRRRPNAARTPGGSR